MDESEEHIMGTAIYRNARLNHPSQPLERAPSPRVRAAAQRDAGVQQLDLCRVTASVFGLAVYLGAPIAGLAYLGFAAARWLNGV